MMQSDDLSLLEGQLLHDLGQSLQFFVADNLLFGAGIIRRKVLILTESTIILSGNQCIFRPVGHTHRKIRLQAAGQSKIADSFGKLHKNILHHIFGGVNIPQQRNRHGEQQIPVLFIEPAKGVSVAALTSMYQPFVFHSIPNEFAKRFYDHNNSTAGMGLINFHN